jgi:hypothetical protein
MDTATVSNLLKESGNPRPAFLPAYAFSIDEVSSG